VGHRQRQSQHHPFTEGPKACLLCRICVGFELCTKYKYWYERVECVECVELSCPGSPPEECGCGHPSTFHHAIESGLVEAAGVWRGKKRRARQASLRFKVSLHQLPLITDPPPPLKYFPSACFWTGSSQEFTLSESLWRRFRIRFPETGS
jgi:hypothetical protein